MYEKLDFDDYMYGEGVKISQRYIADFNQKLQDANFYGCNKVILSKIQRKRDEWTLVFMLGKNRRVTMSALYWAFFSNSSFFHSCKFIFKYLFFRLYRWCYNRGL